MSGRNIILKDKQGNQVFPATTAEQVAWNDRVNLKQAIAEKLGAPMSASTVSSMTDKTRIYVYTGDESGYTKGNWYYWDGSAWVSGGAYNSTAVDTDKTLSVSGKAADGEVVGQKIDELKGDIDKLNEGGLLLKDDVINEKIASELTAHPEWTTTVQDAAITDPKIHPDFLLHIKNEFVTPEMYGAKGDGIADDTEAICEAINKNPLKTIVFSRKYAISKTIKTKSLDSQKTPLYFINNASITALPSFEEDFLIDICGNNNGLSSYSDSKNDCGIYHAILNCNGYCSGLKVSNCHLCNVSYVTIDDAKKYGAYLGVSNNNSLDCYVNYLNCNCVDANNTETIGMYIDSCDNKICNVRVSGCCTGVYIQGSGNYLFNVHPLYTKYNARDNYNNSIAFNIRQLNFLTCCYADTFSVGFNVPANINWHGTNLYCYWYLRSGDTDKHIFINIEGDKGGLFNGHINGAILDVPKFGINYGVFCKDLWRTPNTYQTCIKHLTINNVDGLKNKYDYIFRTDVCDETKFFGQRSKQASTTYSLTDYYLLGYIDNGSFARGKIYSERGMVGEFSINSNNTNISEFNIIESSLYAGTSKVIIAIGDNINDNETGQNIRPVYYAKEFGMYYGIEFDNILKPNYILPSYNRVSTVEESPSIVSTKTFFENS